MARNTVQLFPVIIRHVPLRQIMQKQTLQARTKYIHVSFVSTKTWHCLLSICHDYWHCWQLFLGNREWKLYKMSHLEKFNIGHRCISLTKASHAELWCFLWSGSQQTVEETIETPVIWDAIALIMTSANRPQHVFGIGRFQRLGNRVWCG